MLTTFMSHPSCYLTSGSGARLLLGQPTPRGTAPNSSHYDKSGGVSPGFQLKRSHSFLIKARLDAAAVNFKSAVLADRIGPLKDPILPSCESSEDLGLHR